MNILGINAYHGDSSAAIICDGRLVAAAEEERFTRVKHWAGFPVQSIAYCLQQAGIRVTELDHVAVSFNPGVNLRQKLLFAVSNRPELQAIVERVKRQSRSTSIREHLAAAFECDPKSLKATFHSIEHHLCHIASCYFTSPYEQAAILSIDGMGDFVSTVLASGQGESINMSSRVYFPHSLGYLYNALTIYLGFPKYGDEFKVMGLAPYGQPRFTEEMDQLIRAVGNGFELDLSYFTHHRKGIALTWDGCAPSVAPFHSSKLEELFGHAAAGQGQLSQWQEDIAASLQAKTEDIIFHLLRQLHKQVPVDQLCLAGGVAMNSVANGKIYRETPFSSVYVPVGAADNGTSIGAAFYVWNSILHNPRSFTLEHAFWGPAYNDAECATAIAEAGIPSETLTDDALISATVDALCDGQVVGWYQGRMEFGARALGNRSLLADPRRADMRDIINLRIKFREIFRPFAPSVLEEYASEYFEDDVPSPFMEKVVPIRSSMRSLIPAITHVDGTGRLQTVSRSTNPLYWRLIDAFYNRTGIPMLLNTSLNENEPIV